MRASWHWAWGLGLIASVILGSAPADGENRPLLSVEAGLVAAGSNRAIVVMDRSAATASVAMMLWGRHTSQYVGVGSYRFVAALENFDGKRAMHVILRRFDGSRQHEGWKIIWKSPIANAHQNPTLLAHPDGSLHVIHNTAFLANSDGKIVHYRISGLAKSTPDVVQLSAVAWSGRNYYLGGAISQAGLVHLCATNMNGVGEGEMRCSVFNGHSWAKPSAVASRGGHAYLYPAVQPIGEAHVLVATSAYDIGSGVHANRAFNSILKLQISSDTGEPTLENTVADGALGGHFEEDVAEVSAGSVVILLVEAQSRARTILRHVVNGVVKSSSYTPLVGSSHNLFTDSGLLHIVGGGEHVWTADDGSTWNCGAYEAQNFPKRDYNYGVAHTMKGRSGARSTRFLQEVVEKQTGRSIVIELSISEHGTASSPCAAPADDPMPKQYLQAAAIISIGRGERLLAANASDRTSN